MSNIKAAYVPIRYKNASNAWVDALIPLTKFVALNEAELGVRIEDLTAADTAPLTEYAGSVSVTQATSKSTGVTLHRPSGLITLNNAGLDAATIVSFVLTNTSIGAGDVLVLNHVSAGTPGSYTLNGRCAAGSATIDLRNNTAGTLSEAIVISFQVLKAATA